MLLQIGEAVCYYKMEQLYHKVGRVLQIRAIFSTIQIVNVSPFCAGKITVSNYYIFLHKNDGKEEPFRPSV